MYAIKFIQYLPFHAVISVKETLRAQENIRVALSADQKILV